MTLAIMLTTAMYNQATIGAAAWIAFVVAPNPSFADGEELVVHVGSCSACQTAMPG